MRIINKELILAATDLGNYLSCNHLTELSKRVASGELKKPYFNDPALEILIKRGEEHEAAYVKYLLSGKKVITLKGESSKATINAMKEGYDVIVQAKLEHANWMGYADILIKVPVKSNLGNWSYEVQDTKLSQNTRPESILQLCLYSEIIEHLQGTAPEYLHVVTPGEPFQNELYRFADFHAYFNLIKRSLEQVIAEPEETYPDPVEHCNICAWWKVCDKKRHDDDHLSLVAGIRSSHINELTGQGIETLEQFALAKKLVKPERGNFDALKSKQAQAKIQLDGRVAKNTILHKLLEIEEKRGFNRLPVPTPGDIYFDIEGDRFYENQGLEYMLGFVYRSKGGKWVYEKILAKNRLEEKRAFQQFIGFVMERMKKYPDLCIYHYAPYEPTAIKRLTQQHGVLGQEVDKLLRGLRFVDLYSIIKETLIASVERYSLKDLEKLPRYVRNVPLHDAGLARRTVECALELNELDKVPQETLQTVVGYNEDDCMATLALHQWLEKQRDKELKSGKALQRFEINNGEASETAQEKETRTQALFTGLTAGLPEDQSTWTDQDKAKWLLAHQIDYFRRESKSAWWDFFRVHEMTEHEELLDERKAITGLKFIESLPLAGRERIPTHRYSFPPQEIGIKVGDDLKEIKGDNIGKVQALSLDSCTIDVKKTSKTVAIHPTMVHVLGIINPGPMVTSIMNLAESIIEDGMVPRGRFQAAKDLLLKNKPRLKSGKVGALLQKKEDHVKGVIRLAMDLKNSVLAIQGPPGSGKTYTGAKMIIELAKTGKKIGVTAVSHKVILNLFEKVLELSKKEKFKINLVHKAKDISDHLPDGLEEVSTDGGAIAALSQNKIVGGTAWLWSSDVAEEQLDYLFVDEAGQMSLTQVLAASRSAKNLILLGDPQQLEQPQQGAHPEGSDVAALTYLLDGNKTMPDDRGLFLATTRRLHPDICKFTSEVFYENRLESLEGLDKQVIRGGTKFKGAGLFYVPVVHEGNQFRSQEEIDVIEVIVNDLIKQGKWTNEKGETKKITIKDILIVAPYNAQVSALKERLPDFRVGTVDKFQGQEAAVVIYSMTCSTSGDAPRGMSFLYNPNRFNVATSRAMSACILVASPKLMEPECKTIEQMKWANAFCRYQELAVQL
jgi:predicted RecB family nuclease